jgi:hypothetical protein
MRSDGDRDTRKPKRGKAKTPTVTATPALVPQPGGRGALYQGGVPGNRGGVGRPPSAIRAHCRGSFSDRIAVLEAIADGDATETVRVPLVVLLAHAACPKCGEGLKVTGDDPDLRIEVKRSAQATDRIAAVDKLGKYGLDARTQMSVDDVRERLRATVGLIREAVPTDEADRLLERIRPLWAV